ncbi:uncharacterized protein LOC132725621 isoform X26 [Ruditapes philippinarum]|uniref:uncharacterized protein LOC132725621 isoform X26 n=1 Tax=Ruditapes philippinarum TaxID=129788 RepID=UPI00295C002C|nr:uncharacterized protein LOC132725621 isoform X26 [Ruditapes philippinarum]
MMAGSFRGGMLSLAVFLVFLIGEIRAQGDDNISCGSTQFDLVIILDASTSVQPENWNKTLLSTQRLVRDIDSKGDNVRIGVVVFSTEAHVEFHLNSYKNKEDIIDAISRIKYTYGMTNTADALKLMRTEMFSPANGDRPGIANLAIVITDGESTVKNDSTIPEANRAREQGIQIYAIGIGLTATVELNAIAGRPENRYFIDNFDELDEKMERIYKNICPETTTQLPPTTSATTPLRSTSPKGPCTRTSIDLVFVLDTSTSVTETNFRLMIAAVNGFVSHADIDTGNTKIAVITYSTKVRVEFDLKTYGTKEKLLNAINAIEYTFGDTNTADAIKMVRTRSFTPFYGDREGIPNVAVIVTDGVSNINHYKTIPEAKQARESGIEIYAIGVGVSKTDELDAIAGQSGHRFDIENFEELEINLDSVYKSLCGGKAWETTLTPDIICSSTALDVVFALDSSTSMGKKNFQTMLDATKSFIASADVDSGKTRFGLLIYSTSYSIKFHLNRFRTEKEILEAMDNIEYMAGSTNTAGALKVMRNDMFSSVNGARKEADMIGIIITDGVSNINYHKVLSESDKTRRKGIILLAIGVGLNNTKELDTIAGNPENKLNIDRFDELEFKLDTFIRSACSDVIVYSDLPKLSCRQSDFDLIFVLDFSEYVRESEFKKVLKTVHDFVAAVDINGDHANVGILVYNSLVINLNSYTKRDSLLEEILKAKKPSSIWPFSDGIHFLDNSMFTNDHGDRDNAQNVAVIITDGKSDFASWRSRENLKALTSRGVRVLLLGIETESPSEFYNVADYIATESAQLLPNFDELRFHLSDVFEFACMGTNAEDQCGLKSDLVIIIDASTSVTQANYDKQLQFTKDLLRNSDIDSGAVRVGILIYSTEVEIQFHLNRYSTKAEVFAAIDKIPYIYGSTNTADAISTMHKTMFTQRNGDRPDVPNTCIVITDGVSNINSRKTIPNAEAARAGNIHIYAVGIGLRDTRELDGIASTPHTENSFNVQSFDELKGLDKKIFSALCPTKKETTTAVVPTQQPGCGLAEVDLVIIIDASTSVTAPNFQKMRDFCKDLVDYADVDSGSVRIGVLIYSTDVQIQFNLNEYKTTSAVKAAIDNIPYIYGSTNTADAIMTMHSRMFTRSNGDRPGVPNIGIVLTDGVSNINSRRTIPEANTARRKDIEVYAIGIGLTDTREVDAIANTPTDQFSFNVKKFEELAGLAETIFGGEGGGAGCGKPATTTIAPKPDEKTCGLTKVDVVIILDASTSVTQANFNKMLQFAKDIVDKANVDSGSVRIGCLIYSTEVEIQFYLDEYKTNDAIKAAIDKIPYIYGSTNSADALKVMHEKLFDQRRGDRSDVENVAFMITDGVSNINSRRTIPEAERAIGKGITVYAIGIGLTDTRELRGMASEPKDEYMFNVQKFDELTDLVETIFGGGEECVNEPPVADAGNDVSIQLPVDSVILDGTRSTDDVEVTQYQWIKKSGGRVTMLGEESAILNLANLEAGEYVFTLTVFDVEGQSDDDDVRVIVEEQDFPPTADAGDDIEIQLPDDTVTLNGDGSSDDIRIVRYSWEFASGDDSSVTAEGMDSSSPTLSGLSEGVYNLKLTVYDELGQMDEDTVTINVKAQDFPPVADAGEDVLIQLPDDTVNLNGAGSTDDIEVVRYQWEFVGDTRSVNARRMDTARPTLSGLMEGDYTLKLTVYDGLGQMDYDTVSINVKAQDFPPVADAGEDVLIQLPDDTVNLNGAGSTDDIEVVSYQWEFVSGDGSSVNARGMDTARPTLSGLKEGDYTLKLTVYDGLGQMDDDTVSINVKAQDFPPTADAGDDVEIQLPINKVTLAGDASTDDIGVVRYQWELVNGNDETLEIEGDDTANPTVTGLKEGPYTFKLTVYDQPGQSDIDEVDVIVKAQDFPPVANAGDDVVLQLPKDKVTLSGEKSTDDRSIVAYVWEVVSGDPIQLDDEASATPTASGLDAGSYTLKLTVFDELGQFDEDEVNINVKAQDYPPVANAGPDIDIQLPVDTASFSGFKSSDDVGIVRYEWSIDDDSVKLNDADSMEASVAGLEAGRYTLTLTVFDEQGQSDKDDLVINVKERDFPPVADAGEDATIKLPTNEVKLDGTGSTDDVRIVDYTWRLQSGDGRSIRFDNTDNAETKVRGLDAGTYTFELTVADELGQTDVDTVTITVTAADIPPVARAGDDVTIKLPVNYVTLDGSRSSDDLGIVRYRWRMRSGDKSALKMKGDRSPVLRLTDMKPGNYRFSLTVTDAKRLKDTDYVEVTVLPDDPPIANAGEDMTVQYPTGTVSIYGDQSSDDVGIVTYDWKLLSGDGSINTFDTDRANMGIRNAMPGDYVFELTVTDESGNQDTDQMRLTVLPEPTTTEEPCGLDKTDVIFVVDASTSVTEANFKKQLEFMKSIVEFADVDTGSVRFGALIYSTEVEIQFHLDSYRTKAEVLDAVDKIPYIYGSTNTADGLKTMRDTMFSFRRGDRSDAPNVAIVITDGVSNINSRRTIPEAEQTRDDGIHIYAVGIGLTDTRELNGIASVPASENAFAVSTFDELSGLGNKIFTASCAVVTTTTTTPAPTTTTVITTTQPPMPTTTSCGLSKTDLVFILDASTSVTEANFQKMRDFLKDFLTNADINSGSVRVGINIYSTDVQIMFHLNEYQKEADVMAAIDRIPYIYGSTNTADALKVMRNEMFVASRGDRPDAPNVCVLLTDGISNINSRRTLPEAATTRDDNIHIYVIGIGLKDTREVEGIASPPISQNLFNVQDFDELVGLKQRMFSASCEDTPCGFSNADVVFLLDTSSSVTAPNFRKMLSLTKLFVREANIDTGSVRIGLAIFSDDTNMKFHLDTFTIKTDILRAIDNIYYTHGSTNIFDALKTMRTKMFRRSMGDRPNVKNYAVLITDGVSDLNARKVAREARKVRASGIHMYTIGIGLSDTTEILSIASEPASENSFPVSNFDQLGAIPEQMFKGKCKKDEPPVANAGKDLTIELPDDTVLISGAQSTDDNGIVEYVWSQISGPRLNVALTDNQFLELTGLKEGEYEIELKVVDAEGQSDTDTVSITVLPEPDLPPRADAGDDQTIRLPTDSVVLDGRRSSDDKGIVEYDWELTSPRDRSVRLRGDNTQKLTADNLKEGSYVFTLTVKDKKGQSDSDSARITVLPAPDEPPIANAGQDYEIQLPTDSVILDGSRSTDDIGITSYRWTLTSGNTRGVRMSGERTDTLTLDNLQAGEYVARLSVSDRSRQTSADEARIVVKPRPLRTSGYDVIFILDSSVSPSQFSWMNNYARNVIREMSIDDGEFRVGYLTYSHGAYRQFDLNDNDNKADVLAAIDRVDYKPGSKNTASAFKYARSRMFTPQNGDRDFAENYIIHLTGGGPSNNPFDSATEACTLQGNKVGMFAVGFGEIPDKSELDAHSSLPTSDYEMEIRAESEMGEKPGLMLYQLKNGSPRPSICPTEAPTTTGAPGVCSASGDIVFILDSSGSVGQDNFYRVLNFTYATIDGLDIDNGRFRVGVTTFSDTSRLDFNLDEFHDKADMEAALKQVVYMYGNTHTAHALRRARLEMFTMTAGDRPDVPNVIVIITDGQSNVNHELTIPEARALKAAGVTIITVAVGFTSETSELIGLTSPPVSENLIYVQNYESLNQLKNQLISPLCTDSNLCRKKPCQNGGVCMDGIRSFVCLCPDDFFGDTCSKQCGEPADVVIVLDSSNTVGEYNFGRLKEYAEHLVREMNKDSCDVNIGFLKYSSAAMVQVNLGMYADTETNVRALDQISYTRGRANMAAAFRALRTQMFNGQNGDRTGARNIAYFLTDGTNDVNADRTEPEAELTISSGVRIIPIGINLRERFEVDNIAGNQGLKVIEIRDESNLLENTDTILQPLFEGNDFCKENPCSNGGKCMNEPFGYTCDCPVGYTGDTCQKQDNSGKGGCTAKGDVVFAVDTSRYVTRSELKKVRRFLRSVVKRMRFKRNEFSVGMVQFTDWAKVTLDFNEGRSKKAVRSSIAGLRVHGGDPEPATALAKANYRIFSSNGADREKPDYLILVTKSMRGEEEILKEANKLKLRGTRVLGVGLGLTDKEQEYMESTVSMPYRETAMFATDAKELADIADRVVEYMCDDEDLCAESPCRNGGVCRSLGGDFYCECGIGYAGKFCENRCEARADIVFLLDSSGSVGHIDFRRVKQFVHNMVSDLQIGRDKTRVGLVTYSSNSRHGFFMSKYYNLYELQNAIAGIGYEYGDTNTAAGLRLVRERYFGGANGDRQNIQNFLIIVTDGVSNINPDETITEAKMLKDEGVHIYAVGIGNFDHYEINSIASPPAAQNAFILSDYTALGNISSSIVKKTCRDPTVCEENPCRNGGLCVPGINGPFCECRVGYRGENCQDSCVTVKDIYFLMDSSDSVGAKNYQTALNFIASIAEEFSGEGSYNRFSLMTFSDDVQIVFSLGRYTRLPVLMNAIKFARYRPGKTNTAAAFRTVSEISVDALGDRNDAENIIFVITDGDGNVDEETTVDAAKALKDDGARIIPIAVNMNDYTEIEQIASNRNDIFKVSTFNDLESILDDIVVTTCRNGNEITTNG